MDDEEIVRAKAQEMAETLFERYEPKGQAMFMEHFRADIEERVRAFYAETGEWPFFKRDPYGRGLTMATKEGIDQLPPPDPPPPRRPPISEEARRILREDKELRAALRDAYFLPPRMMWVETWAKQSGMTAEEFINTEIDANIDSGWGEAFQVFRANHGRYPDHTEVNEAARMASEENH